MKNKDNKIKELNDKLHLLQKQNNTNKSLDGLTKKIVGMQESIYEKDQRINVAYNNYIQNLNNQTNNNRIFNVDLALPEKERLDHLKVNDIMTILNQKTFNKTLGLMIEGIFFHPYAPQNWRWCITDMNEKYGALEYDFESNTLVKRSTKKVIEVYRTVICVLGGMPTRNLGMEMTNMLKLRVSMPPAIYFFRFPENPLIYHTLRAYHVWLCVFYLSVRTR